MNIAKTFRYNGLLQNASNGEEEVLALGDPYVDGSYIAEELMEDIGERFVSVRYYCSKSPIKSVEDAEIRWLKTMDGWLNADYGMAYTEVTGYLWTTEELEVGGHDLLAELSSHVGEYILLIVDVYEVEGDDNPSP